MRAVLASSFALGARFGRGAVQVPRALAFLVRRPRLWPAAALPAAVTAALVTLGLVTALLLAPAIETALWDRLGLPPEWRGFAVFFGTRLGIAVGGVLGGFAVALALAAPLLDRLSRQVEAATKGDLLDRSVGLRWEVAESLRGATYFLLRAPLILALGFVPFVGPFLSALWAAHALSFQNTDPALARQGLGFTERRAWHRRHRAESLGLGFAGLVTFLVPCGGFLLAPLLVTAGTRLVLDRDLPPTP